MSFSYILLYDMSINSTELKVRNKNPRVYKNEIIKMLFLLCTRFSFQSFHRFIYSQNQYLHRESIFFIASHNCNKTWFEWKTFHRAVIESKKHKEQTAFEEGRFELIFFNDYNHLSDWDGFGRCSTLFKQNPLKRIKL